MKVQGPRQLLKAFFWNQKHYKKTEKQTDSAAGAFQNQVQQVPISKSNLLYSAGPIFKRISQSLGQDQ